MDPAGLLAGAAARPAQRAMVASRGFGSPWSGFRILLPGGLQGSWLAETGRPMHELPTAT